MVPLDTKEIIVNSSIELFSRKGFTETSIKDIADLSGIKTSSIYYYFDSKLDILHHILDIYILYTTSNTWSRETIDEKAKTGDAREVLMSLFYRFNPDEAMKYTKILKIILHEQYRNEMVGTFVRNYFVTEMEEYIGYIIVKLIENRKLGPVNHRYYAKILNDLLLASSIQYGHFSGTEGYSGNGRIRVDDLLSFVIDLIINDPGGGALHNGCNIKVI